MTRLRQSTSQSGMTLIEVMIAVVLFTILGAGILTALRVAVNGMERTNARMMENRRAAYAVRILESQLTGFMAQSAVVQLTPQSPIQIMPFFQGEPASMRFVSSYSLQDASRGLPQILEFQVIPGAERGVRLVVNERPFTGPLSIGALSLGFTMDPFGLTRMPVFKPIQTGPWSFVLADKLAYCRFFFEGPRLGPTVPGGWVNHWIREEWPIAIRIEMAPFDPNPARLQPMTVTSAVHVNKNTAVQYADN
jgi:prepilin-type N-terminal cleavage/methylation domain-containing protein